METVFFVDLYDPENITKEDILKGFQTPYLLRRRKIIKYTNFEEFRAYEKKFNINLKEA